MSPPESPVLVAGGGDVLPPEVAGLVAGGFDAPEPLPRALLLGESWSCAPAAVGVASTRAGSPGICRPVVACLDVGRFADPRIADREGFELAAAVRAVGEICACSPVSRTIEPCGSVSFARASRMPALPNGTRCAARRSTVGGSGSDRPSAAIIGIGRANRNVAATCAPRARRAGRQSCTSAAGMWTARAEPSSAP